MSMVLPGVVGFKLTGKLRNGVTATDLVLTVTQMLRSHGVVGKFVEFYGMQVNFSISFKSFMACLVVEIFCSLIYFNFSSSNKKKRRSKYKRKTNTFPNGGRHNF